MPDDFEQLHADAIAAVDGKTLHDLDFVPLCDFHRVYDHLDRPAGFAFTCRKCHIVELRCAECATKAAQRLHAKVECQQCKLRGCFHQVIRVTPIGGVR